MARKWIVEVKSQLKSQHGDAIHLQHMSGSEELGRPFRIELDLLTKDGELDLNKQVGESITVSFETRNRANRYFNGVVSKMSYGGVIGGFHLYKVVMRPWIWFLSHASNNRIFQEMSAPEIVKEIFSEHGFSCKDSVGGGYQKRNYCVQYGETDFDFVSRLLEEEGIYYFFEHGDGKHDLVLADESADHKSAPNYSQVKFYSPDENVYRDEDHIDEWEWSHRVETHKFSVRSYDYENSKTELKAEHVKKQRHGQSGKERYEYGKLYSKKLPEKLAQIRLEEQLVNYSIANGGGSVRGLATGYRFSLEQFPRKDQNAEYLVIAASYDLDNSHPETGFGEKEPGFNCSFEAIRANVPFRPARITPKALVRGPQTALVVGPSGDEIWTDKFGRVKVQFPWDRKGKKDEKTSCWVRVSTALAGQNWGFVAIPRIGQEVVVDFLEGDPDQPIITGSVYNDANMPPYDLPGNQTQSGIKTRSTKKGSDKNFNELRFEDKKDSEEIFFHAEKDFKRVVKNNDTLKVGLETKDKGNQTIEIHNDRTATLNEGNDTLTIKKGDQKLDVKEGNQNVYVKKKIDIEAGDQLRIKVGQSTLVMKKNGDITVNGMKIKIKANNSVDIKGTAKLMASGAQVKIAGTAMTDVKAPMVKVGGSAMLDLKAGGIAKLKGGLTMIG